MIKSFAFASICLALLSCAQPKDDAHAAQLARAVEKAASQGSFPQEVLAELKSRVERWENNSKIQEHLNWQWEYCTQQGESPIVLFQFGAAGFPYYTSILVTEKRAYYYSYWKRDDAAHGYEKSAMVDLNFEETFPGADDYKDVQSLREAAKAYYSDMGRMGDYRARGGVFLFVTIWSNGKSETFVLPWMNPYMKNDAISSGFAKYKDISKLLHFASSQLGLTIFGTPYCAENFNEK